MEQEISATEFKATCLDLLDRVGAREIGRLAITKRGKVVAVLTPPPSEAAAVRQIGGFLRGSVAVPDGMNLAEPVLDDPLDSESGVLHG